MILVHGVSMGEVQLMRPLIPLIEEHLHAQCMLSTSTDTGWQSLQKYFFLTGGKRMKPQ
jgi:3-deoxy-D-manno-octulosonic-acid transferase